MGRIPSEEVAFHPHSHGDPAGRLFLWNGELYRGIRAEWAPLWGELLEKGVIQRLVNRGLLIDTEPTALRLDGFDLVVRHRRVPFASYPEEWCAAMLKDAALAILDFVIELAPHGLTLKDGHPWNVLLDAGKFIYVDLTSLTPLTGDGGWPGYDSFCHFCLYPLLLMSHGHDRIARRLLPESEGVRRSDLRVLTRDSAPVGVPRWALGRLRLVWERRVPASCRRLLKRSLKPLGALVRQGPDGWNTPLGSLKRLRRQLDTIPLPHRSPEYLGQDMNVAPTVGPQVTWTRQEHALHQILMDLQSESVLTIGGDTQWCCRVAALLNKRVVSFDTDPSRVTQLYCEARARKLPILPLIMDFADPTPARGLFGHWAIAATDRFQCDMVIALNLVHHMVFRRLLDFAHIAGGLGLFSKRWLVVEFVPPDDHELHGSPAERLTWYTLENFVDALRRRFRNVTVVPCDSAPRVLLVCEK